MPYSPKPQPTDDIISVNLEINRTILNRATVETDEELQLGQRHEQLLWASESLKTACTSRLGMLIRCSESLSKNMP